MTVEIGRDYMDQWGRLHHIYGYVKDRKDQVYSLSDHFWIKTGISTSGTHPYLVILPPKKEWDFWHKRLSDIESNNHEDNLKLVAQEMARMRERLQLLGRHLQNPKQYPLS